MQLNEAEMHMHEDLPIVSRPCTCGPVEWSHCCHLIKPAERDKTWNCTSLTSTAASQPVTWLVRSPEHRVRSLGRFTANTGGTNSSSWTFEVLCLMSSGLCSDQWAPPSTLTLGVQMLQSWVSVTLRSPRTAVTCSCCQTTI